MAEFVYPEFWSFKPFFTLQPVATTREKQLNSWKSFILQYCAHARVARFDPNNFPLFRNDAIDRSLSPQAKGAVVNSLIRSGSLLACVYVHMQYRYSECL
jgi:ESCRT-II complex subunit VPS25